MSSSAALTVTESSPISVLLSSVYRPSLSEWRCLAHCMQAVSIRGSLSTLLPLSTLRYTAQVISEDNTRRTRILRHSRQIEGLLSASSTTPDGAGRDAPIVGEKPTLPEARGGNLTAGAAQNMVAVPGTDVPPGAFTSVAARGAEALGDASPTTASATTPVERLHDPGAAGSAGLHESLISSPRRGLTSPDEAPTSTGGRRFQGDKPGAAQARPSAVRATLDGTTPGPAENPALDNLFRVFLVFQEMRSRGVRPDLRAYNALVNACAEVGELDRALEVVSQMADEDQGGGLQPDAVTYTSLIKAAARATPPKVEEAEEVRPFDIFRVCRLRA